MRENHEVIVRSYVSRKQAQELRELAFIQGGSVSALLREAAQRYLDQDQAVIR